MKRIKSVFVFMRTNIDLLEKIQQKYALKCYPTRRIRLAYNF